MSEDLFGWYEVECYVLRNDHTWSSRWETVKARSEEDAGDVAKQRVEATYTGDESIAAVMVAFVRRMEHEDE